MARFFLVRYLQKQGNRLFRHIRKGYLIRGRERAQRQVCKDIELIEHGGKVAAARLIRGIEYLFGKRQCLRERAAVLKVPHEFCAILLRVCGNLHKVVKVVLSLCHAERGIRAVL